MNNIKNNQNDIIGQVYSVVRDSNNQLVCSRVRFDRQSITPLFIDGMVNVKSQKYPIHVEYEDDDGNIYECNNGWITNITYSYEYEDHLIIERCDLECETILPMQKKYK